MPLRLSVKTQQQTWNDNRYLRDTVTTISANHAITTETLIVCTSGYDTTASLPSASGSGRWHQIKNVADSTVRLQSISGDTIDGGYSVSIGRYGCVTVSDYADGCWLILSNYT